MSVEMSENPVGAYCDWFDVFTNVERRLTEDLLYITGIFASIKCVLFSSYMCFRKGGVFTRKPQSLDSYRNLQLYFYATYLRNVVWTLSRMSSVRDFVRQYFDECNFFAFLETFTGVLEIETLTHVCVERYVVAKYITNGWRIPRDHYNMYLYLSLMFAFGFACFSGSDFSGCICTYQLVLPETVKKSFTVGIFLLRSVKPTVVMIGMLTYACWMERRFNPVQKRLGDTEFTEMVFAMTSVNLVCWTPFSIIKGWVLFSQFFMKGEVPLPSPVYLRSAMWMHFAAPTFALVVTVVVDMLAFYVENTPQYDDNDDDKRA